MSSVSKIKNSLNLFKSLQSITLPLKNVAYGNFRRISLEFHAYEKKYLFLQSLYRFPSLIKKSCKHIYIYPEEFMSRSIPETLYKEDYLIVGTRNNQGNLKNYYGNTTDLLKSKIYEKYNCKLFYFNYISSKFEKILIPEKYSQISTIRQELDIQKLQQDITFMLFNYMILKIKMIYEKSRSIHLNNICDKISDNIQESKRVIRIKTKEMNERNITRE